ncbi:hypothetical protein [Pyrobaculum sp.]|uniref:hypothetical protein n=1 Tax=Pyrobaculum sp. TaxID=2004705 RepID=UPI003166473F
MWGEETGLGGVVEKAPATPRVFYAGAPALRPPPLPGLTRSAWAAFANFSKRGCLLGVRLDAAKLYLCH